MIYNAHLPRAGLMAFAAALVLLSGQSQAAELELPGKIDRVTVYPDRAAVTRVIESGLASGSSIIRIPGLPGNLVAESLRASVVSGSASILSLETRKAFSGDLIANEERRLAAAIETLQDRRKVHEDEKRAAHLEIEALSGIGRSIPTRTNSDIAAGSVDPEKLSATLSLVATRLDAAFSRVRDAEAAQREIDREIQRLRQELEQVRTGSRETTVAELKVHAPSAEQARIELTYQVGAVGWRPLYTARLSTKEGRLELAQRAEVRQRSGEDWNGARLTLATSRPSARPQAPELQPWLVDIRRSAEYRLRKSEGSQALSDSVGSAANAPAAAEPEAVRIAASAFQASYIVPGRVDVPADSAPHTFAIARNEMEAALALRAVPKIDTQAYLYGEATFDGEAPLLPGTVALFRDGTFVGRTDLDGLSPGEDFRLAFGVDDKVRIEHRMMKGERSSNGIISKATRHERRFKTTVTSYHNEPIELTLVDQLPVAQDERIDVVLLDDATPPTETDFEDRRGLVAWTRDLQPSEAWEVTFGYRVEHPAEEGVVGF